MAILRLESFDYYGFGQEAKMLDNDWPQISSATLNTDQVRTGVYSCRCGWHSGGTWGVGPSALIGVTLNDVIVGAAMYFDELPSGVNPDAGILTQTVGGRLMMGVAVNSDGTVSVWRNNQTFPGGAIWELVAQSDVGDTRFVAGTWCYMEIKFFYGSGDIIIRINNQHVLTCSSSNIQGTTPSRIIFDAGNDNRGTFYLDDVYIADTTEADPANPADDFLGDIRVFTLSPASTGAVTQWTAVGSSPNWSCVDEIPTDDDSSYVQATSIGLVDSYQMSDLDPTVTGLIKGVQVVTRARKTDSGDAQIRANLRSGMPGNAVDTGDAKVLTTSYVFYRTSFHVDPQSNLPFTIAGVNALETQIETVV